MKFYTDEGNWDMVGNNTPVFFLRDPLKFPDLNHAVKGDPRTNLRSAKNNWDFWTSLPEALHQNTMVNRNPENFFAEVEQSAFNPAHVVPGIGFSPDKMLQGRLFNYGS